uniref:Cytochrome P450 n=1 Tax=Pavo cristatus TaxID=9049 RepID=A0A8C9FKX6_PAVCR
PSMLLGIGLWVEKDITYHFIISIPIIFRAMIFLSGQFRKKFGNVFSLQNCWTNVVVLNGYKTVKEALVNKSEDFADRPYFPVYEHLGYGHKSEGVVLARYGHVWKELRKFTLTTLRNFGMGKKSLEERVIEEAGFLCSAINSEGGLSHATGWRKYSD